MRIAITHVDFVLNNHCEDNNVHNNPLCSPVTCASGILNVEGRWYDCQSSDIATSQYRTTWFGRNCIRQLLNKSKHFMTIFFTDERPSTVDYLYRIHQMTQRCWSLISASRYIICLYWCYQDWRKNIILTRAKYVRFL